MNSDLNYPLGMSDRDWAHVFDSGVRQHRPSCEVCDDQIEQGGHVNHLNEDICDTCWEIQ